MASLFVFVFFGFWLCTAIWLISSETVRISLKASVAHKDTVCELWPIPPKGTYGVAPVTVRIETKTSTRRGLQPPRLLFTCQIERSSIMTALFCDLASYATRNVHAVGMRRQNDSLWSNASSSPPRPASRPAQDQQQGSRGPPASATDAKLLPSEL
ncbi:hypothetical protein EDB86DRAFT_2831514 [Lactarius hatsudake]|nr:hypothetical protein EDB86DRAFT_2831514 [Lactarius hatsudake]